MTALVWYRDDLRISDHPALSAAVKAHSKVAFIYVLDDKASGVRPLGGAARWWMAQSLRALQASLSERGATRMDDRTSDASMERRKKEGYF